MKKNRILFFLTVFICIFTSISVSAVSSYKDVFTDKLGINPKDIVRATYFYSDSECLELPDEEIDKLRNKEGIWYDYVIAPPTEDNTFPSDGWLKIYTDDKTAFMYLGSVLVGEFGKCDTVKNYAWYKTAIANSSNAIVNVFFHWSNPDFKKNVSLRAITKEDLSDFPSENVLNFSDTDEWAKNDLQATAAKNLIPPYMTEQMREPIKRDEFCSLAYRTIATCLNPASDSRTGIASVWDGLVSDTDNHYTDADYENTQYTYEINALSEIGIIKGDGNGIFRPQTAITREEAAVILERMINFLNKSSISEYHKYSDDVNISDWAMESVSDVYGAKIMYGNDNNEFKPKDNYTKQESILTMLRLYDFK